MKDYADKGFHSLNSCRRSALKKDVAQMKLRKGKEKRTRKFRLDVVVLGKASKKSIKTAPLFVCVRVSAIPLLVLEKLLYHVWVIDMKL